MSTKDVHSGEQIERYLQKQMSATEMHSFETQMMNDPFLSDAIDGLRSGNPILLRSHLDAIERIIASNQQDKISPRISFPKWLRIAALVIFLIGAGLITYKITIKDDAKNLVVIENRSTPTADSISAEEQPFSESRESTKKDVLAQKATANDNKTSPVATKEIRTNERAVSAPPVQSKMRDAKSFQMDTVIRLASADTIGITGNATTPQVQTTANTRGNVSSVQPGVGWVKLQAFIDKEVKKAKEKNSALVNMSAEVEFSVNKNGVVEDIKILSASNTEVAKITTSILKRSPRSTSLANNEKAKIVITF